MTPTDYTLQHADVPQKKLHDGECATRDWPMPEPRRWEPKPRELTLIERWKLNQARKLAAKHARWQA